MTEFQELIKDAPKFFSMERGELVSYAYAMYAAEAKAEAENAKLRTQLADVTESMGRVEERCAKLRALCRDMYLVVELLDMDGVQLQAHGKDADWRTLKERFGEMGVEVDA